MFLNVYTGFFKKNFCLFPVEVWDLWSLVLWNFIRSYAGIYSVFGAVFYRKLNWLSDASTSRVCSSFLVPHCTCVLTLKATELNWTEMQVQLCCMDSTKRANWLCLVQFSSVWCHRGENVRTLDLQSEIPEFNSQSGRYQAVTTWMGDHLRTGEPSRYSTNTKVSLVFHPSRVGKLSTSFLD